MRAEAAAPGSPGARAHLARTPATSTSATSSTLVEPPPRARAGAPSCAASSPSSRAPAVRWSGARLEISGELPRGAGLSSSAALEVALCLALADARPRRRNAMPLDRTDSRGCARVSRTTGWARTPACSTSSRRCTARPTRRCASTSARSRSSRCRCALGDWRLVVLDSGERHVHASSGYNERRARVRAGVRAAGRRVAARARAAMPSTRLPRAAAPRAPRTCSARTQRVRDAVAALRADDLAARRRAARTPRTRACATSTRSRPPAVEAAVQRLREAGAARRASDRRRLRRQRARPVRARRRASARRARGASRAGRASAAGAVGFVAD